MCPADVSDYREELMLSLSSARKLAAETIQKAQARNYDRAVKSQHAPLRIGDWALVYFPHEESLGPGTARIESLHDKTQMFVW